MTGQMETYPDEIVGERIVLKILDATPENAKAVSCLVKKNAEYLRSYFRSEVAYSENVQMTLKLLHRMHKLRQENDTLLYHIFHQEKMIGSVEILIYPHERELRYWLDNEAKGKGLMYESVCLVEQMLFERKHDRIILSISDKNTPSLKLAKRLGYIPDAMDCYEITYNRYNRLRGSNKNVNISDIVNRKMQR